MKPSYEELEKALAETRELLKKAIEEIAKLKEQINLNSKTAPRLLIQTKKRTPRIK